VLDVVFGALAEIGDTQATAHVEIDATLPGTIDRIPCAVTVELE